MSYLKYSGFLTNKCADKYPPKEWPDNIIF